MPGLRDLRRKVKSIKSTQQITKAMKMVAAVRLNRAQTRILSARPFAEKMKELFADLCTLLEKEEKETYSHPFLSPPSGSEGRFGLVVITGDKGLCGAFNTNVLNKALGFVSERGVEKAVVFPVGKKGRDFFRRTSLRVREEYVGVFGRLSFAHAELIGKPVMEAYLREPLGSVYLVYNQFKSLVQQKLVVEKLLPIDLAGLGSGADHPGTFSRDFDYLYEPEKPRLLDALIPRFVKAQIFRALLESAAAELAARMSSMDQATRNASDFISSLTLTMNKVRQATITKEIAEVVGGAEALK